MHRRYIALMRPMSPLATALVPNAKYVGDQKLKSVIFLYISFRMRIV